MESFYDLSVLVSGTQSYSTSSKPSLQTILDGSAQLNPVSGPFTSSYWSYNQELQDIALTSDLKAQLSLQNNCVKETLRASKTCSSSRKGNNRSCEAETGLRSYYTSNWAKINSTLAFVNKLANFDLTNLDDKEKRSMHLLSDNLSKIPLTLSDRTFLRAENPTEFLTRLFSNYSSNFPEKAAVSTQSYNISASCQTIESSTSSIVRKVQNSPRFSKNYMLHHQQSYFFIHASII
ncbi:hypothetical protein BY996DRAFT_6411059 [Phakopsora pachyrhizi]|nr:hypothetical protein BY996DRAFT_6411059 [Phakopsora pachyrhizi]